MQHTYERYPFWRTALSDVDDLLATVTRGEVHTLCTSAGGRPIRYVTYGERQNYGRRANYSSACGAHDVRCYADRTDKLHTLLLIGATHGQETEGVAALLNLISLLETGRDLGGNCVPWVTEAFDAHPCRLIIIPVYNVDGRARCVPDSMLDEPTESLRYHGQGTWQDGSLCGWPECKAIHPIKGAAGFLGAYYNDDGINLMHDNFFAPMAPETAALLRLCDEEAPNCAIGLHGGSNTTNVLLQPSYVPLFIRREVLALAEECAALAEERDLKTLVMPLRDTVEDAPLSFNLTSAIHHVCGAVSSTYESNEGLSNEENPFTAEEILTHHYCLFAGLFCHQWD